MATHTCKIRDFLSGVWVQMQTSGPTLLPSAPGFPTSWWGWWTASTHPRTPWKEERRETGNEHRSTSWRGIQTGRSAVTQTCPRFCNPTWHPFLHYITSHPHMYSELHVLQETDGESLTPRSSAAYSSNHNTQSISQGQNFRHIKTRDRHDYMILKTMNVCFKMMPLMMLNPTTLAL